MWNKLLKEYDVSQVRDLTQIYDGIQINLSISGWSLVISIDKDKLDTRMHF